MKTPFKSFVICIFVSFTFSLNLHGSIQNSKETSYKTSLNKLKYLLYKYNKKQISESDLIKEIDQDDLYFLLKPSFPAEINHLEEVGRGIPVCKGASVGRVVFSTSSAMKSIAQGEETILFKNKLSNDDLSILNKLEGVICKNEDSSTHASIVIKVSDTPYITQVSTNGKNLQEGMIVSLDAFNGIIYEGPCDLITPKKTDNICKLMEIIDKECPIEIHANADTPSELKAALEYTATGADPRTEHMFLEPHKLRLFRKVIFIKDQAASKQALRELGKIQTEDFEKMFEAADGLPVVIRLLDPPLEEFIPKDAIHIQDLAKDIGTSEKDLVNEMQELHEENPMMGHRGIRLLITRPEILDLQILSMFKALKKVENKGGKVNLLINIPMVIDPNEVTFVQQRIDIIKKNNSKFKDLKYKIGIMVETPRAVILASELAKNIDFISFGTNDLTGQTCAFSRGDIYSKFLNYYLEKKIIPENPFVTLDKAVKILIKKTVQDMKEINPQIKIGLCGEQGNDPESALFLYKVGLDSISCNLSSIPQIKLYLAQHKDKIGGEGFQIAL